MNFELAALGDALLERSFVLGRRLGAGVEGVVYELGDDLVAKVWHARSLDDLEALRCFTAEVEAATVPLATPLILEVISVPGAPLITIERRLHGTPLREGGQSTPPPVTTEECGVMADVLAALATAQATPGLSGLPLLPGEDQTYRALPFQARLAALIEQRTSTSGEQMRAALPDLDRFVGAVAARLRAVEVVRPVLMHGDLIPANVLVRDGRATAVLDFGFMTTAGDARFDAAITASIFDMYGPHGRTSERTLDRAFAARFGPDERTRDLYRAAYALATATWFGAGPDDGHFRWCLRMLARPEVRRAAGIA